jgi:hypothetical protein
MGRFDSMTESPGFTRAKVFIARERGAAGPDPFELYRPPFDLEADMLFVAATASTEFLARSFDDVPFLDLAGRTPLVVWFSRVRTLCHGPPQCRKCLDEASGFGYNELNVVALVRGRRLFVPVIYAGAGLTQRLGHRYGMPKREASMTFAADSGSVESAASFACNRSEARARLLASGRIFGRAFDWPAPWWTWPVDFPGGSFIRALIQEVPRAQLARVSGKLALDEAWLPRPSKLWKLGVFVPGLRMQLPGP